jgi:hypothetical protein
MFKQFVCNSVSCLHCLKDSGCRKATRGIIPGAAIPPRSPKGSSECKKGGNKSMLERLSRDQFGWSLGLRDHFGRLVRAEGSNGQS